MSRQAVQRLLLAAGIVIAALGVYASSQTSEEVRWDSIVSIAITAVGVYLTVVGLVLVLGTGEPEPPAERERHVLPEGSVAMIYGGFVGTIALVAGLVAGHYIGRNEGFITFIFAFIVANLIFGLPLAIANAGSNR